VSVEPDITSSFAGESNTVKTEAPEISLPEVIEPDYTESEIKELEDIQPEAPQLYTPITSRPFLFLSRRPNHHLYILDLTVNHFHLIL